MYEFFIKLVDALPVALVALPLGWLGGYFGSYFSEKGKNLATKEDIEKITEVVESVKERFSSISHFSTAQIDRQIKAYDDISNEISSLHLYCNLHTWGDDYVPMHKTFSTDDRTTYARAVAIDLIASRHRAFLTDEIFDLLQHLSDHVFHIAYDEKEYGVPLHVREYQDTVKHIEAVIFAMKTELLNAK